MPYLKAQNAYSNARFFVSILHGMNIKILSPYFNLKWNIDGLIIICELGKKKIETQLSQVFNQSL